MPATTAPAQSLALNQKIRVKVAAFAAADGSPDTTTPLTVSSSGANAAAVSVNPADNREVIIAGNNVTGASNVTIGVANTPSPVIVPVTVTAPVNYSHVDFVEATAPEPK